MKIVIFNLNQYICIQVTQKRFNYNYTMARVIASIIFFPIVIYYFQSEEQKNHPNLRHFPSTMHLTCQKRIPSLDSRNMYSYALFF